MSQSFNTSVNQDRNNSYTYVTPSEPMESLPNGNELFNYTEISGAKDKVNAGSVPNSNQKMPPSTAVGVYGLTMGQSQNFTFYIKGFNEADSAFKLTDRGLFLPLKSLDFKPLKLEHLKLKAGIFNELPFFHRRGLGSLSCVMHDSHKSLLSQELLAWWAAGVSIESGCVAYVDDICREAEYAEYTHDGKVAVRYRFVVMPDGEISTSRSYEGDTGALTEYKFNLLVVSEIQAIALGYGADKVLSGKIVRENQ